MRLQNTFGKLKHRKTLRLVAQKIRNEGEHKSLLEWKKKKKKKKKARRESREESGERHFCDVC